MAKAKKQVLSLDEQLEQALVPESEQPYSIPVNWVWARLGATIELHRGVSYKKDQATATSEDNVLVLRGGNINEGTLSLANSDNVYVSAELVSANQLLRKSDIVIVSSTGSKKVIGRAGISPATYTDVAFGAFLTLARPKSQVSKRYINYFFLSQSYRNEIRRLAKGVNINNIKNDYISNMRFPLPPLAEQQRIVTQIESLFQKLDNARDLVQNALDSFETHKAAILHKAFSGELTVNWRIANADIENTVINDIFAFSQRLQKKEQKYVEEFHAKTHSIKMNNGHLWTSCQIGAVGIVTNGSTPSRKIHEYWNEGTIPWVSSGEVRNNIIHSTREAITQAGYDNSSVKQLPVGTVLIAMIGEGKTRGQSAVLNIQATTNQNVAAIIIEHGFIEPHFLWYWLQKEYSNNREKGNGTGPQALNCQKVRELGFIVPSLPEQQEIVRILDSLLENEQKAKDLCDILDQIDLMKKSILARAFRGELGTNNPGEESALELLKEVLTETVSGVKA